MIILIISASANAELSVKLSAGITNNKIKANENRCIAEMQDLQTYFKSQLERKFMTSKTDYISQDDEDEYQEEHGERLYLLGFGAGYPDRSFVETNKNANAKLAEVEQDVRKIFSENKYAITGHLRFEAIDDDCGGLGYQLMKIDAMKITSKIDPEYTFSIADSDASLHRLNYTDFINDISLSQRIIRALEPNYLNLIGKYESFSHPRSQTRSGLTIGLSLAYSHTFFNNDKSRYGIYTGIEAFGEITPKTMKSHGFKIKEKEIGLRPFIGVECRDSWRIFILGGVKFRQLDTKYFSIHQKKTKPAFEIGFGSEYLISDRYLIGLKVIKTMKQRHKMKYDTKFTTTSLKVLFSFGMRF